MRIGAIAFGELSGDAKVIEAAGHREGPLAKVLACLLSARLSGIVALTAGIHYHAITPAEIDTALGLRKN